MQSHKLPTSMSNFIDDFRNSEAIQHTLSAKYPDKGMYSFPHYLLVFDLMYLW